MKRKMAAERREIITKGKIGAQEKVKLLLKKYSPHKMDKKKLSPPKAPKSPKFLLRSRSVLLRSARLAKHNEVFPAKTPVLSLLMQSITSE